MDRKGRADLRLSVLEDDYRSTLVAALRECAGGRWGLLQAPPDAESEMNRYQSPVVAELEELAGRIEAARRAAGHADPFDLHVRLMSERSRRDENMPGEPRRARLWLTELGAA